MASPESISAAKTDYASRMRALSQDVDAVFAASASLNKEWFDMQFGGLGTNEIVEADLTAFKFTVAELTAMVTLAEQMKKFATADPTGVTIADYQATVNRMK